MKTRYCIDATFNLCLDQSNHDPASINAKIFYVKDDLEVVEIRWYPHRDIDPLTWEDAYWMMYHPTLSYAINDLVYADDAARYEEQLDAAIDRRREERLLELNTGTL